MNELAENVIFYSTFCLHIFVQSIKFKNKKKKLSIKPSLNNLLLQTQLKIKYAA